MAMGIPVITNAGVGDVEEICIKYHAGIVLKNMNSEEYNNAASVIAEGKTFNKEEIISGAKEYYNLENAIQKYLYVYKQILD